MKDGLGDLYTKKEKLPPPKRIFLTLRREDAHNAWEIALPMRPLMGLSADERKELERDLRASFESLLVSAGIVDRTQETA